MNYLFRNAWWNKRKRPKIKIFLTIFDIIIEIAGFVAVLAMWILLIAVYTRLPDVIPVHYNGLGQADAFGKKSEIFTLPVIATILFAGMTILSRFPHVFNYPVRITEKNVSFQYGNMARMLRCLKLGLVLIFGGLVLQTIRNAAGNTEGLGVWFMPVLLAVTFIPVLFFMVKSFMYR
jgi:hypothetical protein